MRGAEGEAPRRAEVASDRRRGGIVARPVAEEPRAPHPLGERRRHRVVTMGAGPIVLGSQSLMRGVGGGVSA